MTAARILVDVLPRFEQTKHIYLFLSGVGIVLSLITRWIKYRRSWVDVPVVGDRGIISSWKSALDYPTKTREILQQGYDQHRDFAFQVATVRGWDVCICNEAMVKELQGLPDDTMSLNGFNEVFFQTRYTSPGFADSRLNIPIPVLAKALAWARLRASSESDPYFSGLVTELEHGLRMEIPQDTPEEWKSISCFGLGAHVMLRLIAHVLFGSPLCRDPEAIDLFTRYGAAVPSSGQFISWLPAMLRPWIAPHCAAPKMARRLDAMLLAMIEDRKKLDLKEPQTIADYLCRWVHLEEASDDLGDLHVAQLLVSVIFGSVHSAGMVLASCLYELSTRPEYIEPLRQEVITALRNQPGWTKEAIESLVKLDSFIKESHRHNPLAAASLYRIAKQDFTFNNGLKIPSGTFLYTPNAALLFDERYYEHSPEFDGFRFHRLGQQSGRPDDFKIAGMRPISRQFGAGRHTCPGKQLAADSLRLIMAYIILTFDIGRDGAQGSNGFTLQSSLLLRKRQTAATIQN